ncbi:MAG: L,D-transpeptidase family protein [bacterium]|nr:L,D-transpeptidase family protein [bacterium]
MSLNKNSVFNHPVPLGVVVLILLSVVAIVISLTSLYLKGTLKATEVVITNGEGKETGFIYGSLPALQNASFFETVKQSFVEEKTDFIEADLSAMKLRVYKEGAQALEVPIVSKGRSGSWWETPAGLYKIETKEETHFSSFGRVYMPWSMLFQGNFFIHGWPYYKNGEPVGAGYSGGCIRLSTEDAEKVFALVKKGTPVLIFENPLENNADKDGFAYALKKPEVSAKSFLAADLENNFVFAENEPGEKRSIASLTKLMTALIAVEYINVEREVAIDSSMVVKTSIPRLQAGESFSVLDLLSPLLMESSNEAARAIPKPLGESWFTSLMNKKAEAIGMKQSSFADTSGEQAGNISTAEDLFMLAKYLYYNRSFVLLMSMGKENRSAYGPSAFRNVKNLNEITGTEGMFGGKTGLSTPAGQTMLAVFDIEIAGKKRPIAIIVLGSDDSKRDVETILNYIQSNYEREER